MRKRKKKKQRNKNTSHFLYSVDIILSILNSSQRPKKDVPIEYKLMLLLLLLYITCLRVDNQNWFTDIVQINIHIQTNRIEYLTVLYHTAFHHMARPKQLVIRLFLIWHAECEFSAYKFVVVSERICVVRACEQAIVIYASSMYNCISKTKTTDYGHGIWGVLLHFILFQFRVNMYTHLRANWPIH